MTADRILSACGGDPEQARLTERLIRREVCSVCLIETDESGYCSGCGAMLKREATAPQSPVKAAGGGTGTGSLLYCRCGGLVLDSGLCNDCGLPVAPHDQSLLTNPAVLARRFHALYEELAPIYGYATRPETRVAWESLPSDNRFLMIAVCAAIQSEIAHV